MKYARLRIFSDRRFCPHTEKKRVRENPCSGIFYAVLRRTQICTTKPFAGAYVNMAFMMNDLICPRELSNMMQTFKTINF